MSTAELQRQRSDEPVLITLRHTCRMNLLSLSILTLAMVPLMEGFSRDDNKEYERSLMMADWSPMLATTRQVIFVQQQRLLHRPMGFVQPAAARLLKVE
jgi:hypothetical protein